MSQYYVNHCKTTSRVRVHELKLYYTSNKRCAHLCLWKGCIPLTKQRRVVIFSRIVNVDVSRDYVNTVLWWCVYILSCRVHCPTRKKTLPMFLWQLRYGICITEQWNATHSGQSKCKDFLIRHSRLPSVQIKQNKTQVTITCQIRGGHILCLITFHWRWCQNFVF